MDAVSLELGKSKGTVYKYFKNREDILNVILLNALLEPSFLIKNNLKLEESLRAYFENKMFGMLKR